MVRTLLEPLSEYREYTEARKELKNGNTPIAITGCIDAEKCHFMGALSEEYKYKVVITYNDIEAKKLVSDFKLFDENVYYYPAKDFIFYQLDIKGTELAKERMKVVEQLISGKPCTVVLSIEAGMDKRRPLEVYKEASLSLTMDSVIDITDLESKLIKLGYSREEMVETPGDYSIRGGIVDIYPVSAAAPYRIELWGDEIDTIRVFDAASQRSIEQADSIDIYPATETIFTKDEIEAGVKKIEKETAHAVDALRDAFLTSEAAHLKQTTEKLKEDIEYFYHSVNLDSYITSFAKDTTSIFGYFPEDETVFFIDEPARVKERGEEVEKEYLDSMNERLKQGYILESQIASVYSHKEVYSFLKKKRIVTMSLLGGSGRFKAVKKYDITARSTAAYDGNFQVLTKDVANYKKNNYKTIIVSASRTRARRLAADLTDYELPAFFTEDKERVCAPGEIMIIYGQLSRGFEYPLLKFVVITETEIFGAKRVTPKKEKKLDGRKLLDFSQLNEGDFVVHENHGLGIYRGIHKIETDHVEKDYIKLEYGGGGVLYVPVTALNIMQKYSSADGKKPKLNKLNSQEWRSTKSRVKASINEVAKELVELYAKRMHIEGYAYSKDNTWQNEFEEMFPYEETRDQLKAIEETKADMESSKIMDRLICGDVGYGKTEIALRAAFKAVQDSKQVAVLVPTTILAQQHYNTFSQRLKDFPVNVDVLSRFKSTKEMHDALKRLKSGELDIIIGTHRLLSKDVEFKNLGLLVVDEEQRFGVTHKEKIKQLKNSVDVLTLSATPIPRTMHMGLIGIRDISVLDEPPVDRLPIQTYVLEHNEEMVREAINRELTRHGQVYYVYNRVAGIEDVTIRLKNALPEARIAYAHGKMNERALEKIMYSFVNGEIDVLVSTTIIETGMDISNVNTIIIDDCDRFGLSQLYQLRGRVGRSNRTAYAFLMYRKDKLLKEEAEKRLSAIKEYTELGAGYKIAMKDLEIRGAGNLLGERQSGHMCAVGYDLYCKMLNEAVKENQGDYKSLEYDTAVDLEVNAFIPSTYIKNEVVKLDVYKRIATIENDEDISDMRDELCDRFGDIPSQVDRLLRVSLLRSLAHAVYVSDLKQKGSMLRLELFEKAALDVSAFAEYIKSFRGACKLETDKKPTFVYKLKSTGEDAIIKEVKEILLGMTSLIMKDEVAV